jgi:regulator of sirC expression with transglutaminase-like and TPR domain
MDEALIRLGLLDDADIDLADAALACAAADRPDLDLAPLRARIAGLAGRLLTQAVGVEASRERSALLVDLIAGREGLSGDTQDYDNPANADLAMLFERRRGLPVTLSLLYVALARRVGWTAELLGLPGHVVVAIGGDIDRTVIDPFDHGRRLDAAGLGALVDRAMGGHVTPSAENIRPLTNREVLVRLLTNQATRARRAGDGARALVLAERLTALAPGLTGLWWERARLEQVAGDTAAARTSLAAMLDTTHDEATRRRIADALQALARSPG